MIFHRLSRLAALAFTHTFTLSDFPFTCKKNVTFTPVEVKLPHHDEGEEGQAGGGGRRGPGPLPLHLHVPRPKVWYEKKYISNHLNPMKEL